MSSTVIKVDRLSKQYRLGQVGTGSLAHDFNRWWHKIRAKEDPYLKVGESNDRSKKSSSDYSWALRDVSFEVKEGEVLGIIGKNGAGKSTLLKILSRVTTPTSGRIQLKGRIASLLEVGTGFNPELTGRENIFLNGAILGMRRAETESKFDEIVDFSGCERYIDTPVKRYSSGMYVRLAFAVAAHLEPEILIVDEVLAVGDAEFQKKCIGKMKDVAGAGRTVLFVSHNMASISALCSSALVFHNGTAGRIVSPPEAVSQYFSMFDSGLDEHRGFSARSVVKLLSIEFHQMGKSTTDISPDHPLRIILTLKPEANVSVNESRLGISFTDSQGRLLLSLEGPPKFQPPLMKNQLTQVEVVIDKIPLINGPYQISCHIEFNREVEDRVDLAKIINIAGPPLPKNGLVRQKSSWSYSIK